LSPLELAVTEGSRNPGPLPLLIVVLLGIATVLLIRNMSGRIRRLPPSFPDPDRAPGDEPDERPEDRRT
jgi:hypothetical protein